MCRVPDALRRRLRGPRHPHRTHANTLGRLYQQRRLFEGYLHGLQRAHTQNHQTKQHVRLECLRRRLDLLQYQTDECAGHARPNAAHAGRGARPPQHHFVPGRTDGRQRVGMR